MTIPDRYLEVARRFLRPADESVPVRLEEPDSTPELLRFAGDLAAEINVHLEICRTCRLEYYVTNNPAPLCVPGLDLRRRYREARRAALAAWSGDLLAARARPTSSDISRADA